MHEFGRNCVSARYEHAFVIFALGPPLFSAFQQSAPLCTKERFQPQIGRFCHFRTGRTTFKRVHEFVQNSVFRPRSARTVIFALGAPLCNSSANSTSFPKTAFSSRDQHVLPFSHWVHHFLAIFSTVQQFLQNSVVRTRSACFVIFAHFALLFSDF